MSLRLPLPDVTILEFECQNLWERHITRLHAYPIDRTLVGSLDDLPYLTTNTSPFAETTVIGTCNGFGALWANYYPDTWALYLRAVYVREGDVYSEIDPHPLWSGLLGVNPALQEDGDGTTKRILHLMSQGFTRRRLWIRQLVDGDVAPPVDLGATTGGYDGRDRALLFYLSGEITGALAPDGTPFLPTARLSSWWDQPIQSPP